MTYSVTDSVTDTGRYSTRLYRSLTRYRRLRGSRECTRASNQAALSSVLPWVAAPEVIPGSLCRVPPDRAWRVAAASCHPPTPVDGNCVEE